MKVGVVTRRLVLSKDQHYDPIVSAVFEDPNDPEVDDLEGYFKYRMSEHAKEFAAKVVEFQNAEWTLTVVETLR